MRSRRRTGLAALVIACALAACGGGGNDGDDTIQVTWDFKPFVVDVFDDELATELCMLVTVQPVPSAPPTVRVADSGATYVSGQIDFFAFRTNTYLACPRFQPTLAAGTYAGTLTFTMCKDPGCGQAYPLSDPSVPYSVTVWHVVPGLSPLTATIKLDGVVSTNVNEGLLNGVRTYSVALLNGHTIEVDPSEPFLVIGTDNHGTGARLTSLTHPQPGSVLATVTLPDGVASGAIDLIGRSQDGRTIIVSISVTR